MAPRSGRASGHDTDTSMAEDSEPIRQLPVDPMVRVLNCNTFPKTIQICACAPCPAFVIDYINFLPRTWTKLLTTPKTLIQIQTLLQAVLSATLLVLMAADADPRLPNCAEAFLARNTIASANQRYKASSLECSYCLEC
jgi:hypothetical protein